MKRTITTEIKRTVEEEVEDDSSSPGGAVVTFLFVLMIIIGLHSVMAKNNRSESPQITIDQRGNTGTINNDFESFGNER